MRVFLAGLILTTAASSYQIEAQAQDKAKVAAGEGIYSSYCSTCHGENLVSSGQTFDLRRLKAADRSRFEQSVISGKGQMPPWKGVLSNEQIEQIWSYIRASANEK